MKVKYSNTFLSFSAWVRYTLLNLAMVGSNKYTNIHTQIFVYIYLFHKAVYFFTILGKWVLGYLRHRLCPLPSDLLHSDINLICLKPQKMTYLVTTQHFQSESKWENSPFTGKFQQQHWSAGVTNCCYGNTDQQMSLIVAMDTLVSRFYKLLLWKYRFTGLAVTIT